MDSVVDRFIEACEYLISKVRAKNHTEIAKSIGISPQMMTDIKKGRTRLGLETITNFVKSFPLIRIEWLIYGKGEMTHIYDPVFVRLKQAFEQFNIDQSEVAEFLGVNTSYFDEFHHLSVEQYEKILDRYSQIPRMWLYNGKGDIAGEGKFVSTAETIGNLIGGNIELTKSGNEFIDLGNGQYLMIVPLVEDYAQAGYTAGWSDKNFVDELPKHTIIVTQKHKGLYRAFRVRGISMDDGTTKSICDDDIVTGRAIDKVHWNSRFHLHKFTDYIIVHKEGIIIKTIVEHDVEAGIITCRSRNPDKEKFPDFQIKLDDTVEILNVVQVDRPWK